MVDESIIIPITIDDSGVATGLKKVEAPIRQMTGSIVKLKESTISFISTLRTSFDPAVFKSFKSGTSSVNNMKEVLQALKENMRHATNPAQLVQYNRAIKDVEGSIKKAAVAGTQAGGAMVKGFGDAFGAVRKLSYILPGIGIAGLFQLGATGIQLFIEKMFSATKAVNALKDAQRSATESTGAEIFSLNALVAVARDETQSRYARNNAVDQLQKKYPDYLRNISLETINSDAAKRAIDELTKSLFAKAVAQEFANIAAKKEVEIFDKLRDVESKRARVKKVEGLSDDALGFNATRKSDAQTALFNELKGLRKLERERDEIIKQGNAAMAKSLHFTKTPKPDIEKGLTEAQRLLIKMAKAAEMVFNVPLRLQITELDTQKEQLKKALDTLAGVKDFTIKLKLPDFSKIEAGDVPPVEPEFVVNPELMSKFFDQMKKEFQAPFVPDVTIDVAVFNKKMKDEMGRALKGGNFESALRLIDTDKTNEALDPLKDSVIESAMLINDTLTPAFQGLFDAIIKGQEPLKAFFDSIIQSINQVIQRLIAAAIQAAILSALSGGTNKFGDVFFKLMGGKGSIANRVAFAGGGNRMAPVPIYGVLKGTDIYLSGVAGAAQMGRVGG